MTELDSFADTVYATDDRYDINIDDFHTPLTGPPSNTFRRGIAFNDGDDASASAPPKYIPVQLGPQHFELICKIGQGAFGQVLLVRPRIESTVTHENKAYAMKVISKKLLRAKNNLTYMKSERDIMTKV
jgi:serine/threonine protein kinase